MTEHLTSPEAALSRVLEFVKTIEAGGGSAEIRPFLAPDFELTEAPNILTPEGGVRTLDQVLEGADGSREVVKDQRFDITRSTSDGTNVVLEIDWSATSLMDLRYWDRGQLIRAKTCSVFGVRDGLIYRQSSYDCYHQED
ncbi:nuclear transport factor 2 family protein [Pseudarthrobacter sp. J75]|uniref:nuclear transport factor 2 family protein n=1 Tax=unclassified Pseudarthrobacter TaxID=2647000 RepID=UPI002E81A6BE|nr:MULTISPECIES: nuclear transport factor 2 family protein [unclassified Pseudarthrobacter]MEE2523130.1 nuclear transport factor 2 family protein [Pseudarthrobacter sp. J47]MEE2529814.1 nuclear transport factor 2 family protein [Pseudarthrobacter sp. J75]